MRRPMYKKDKFKDNMFLFNVRREFNGKKYQYGGEYPYNKAFIKRIKETMSSNGYDVYFQFKKPESKIIVWTRRK